jgi:hypothetical protein
MFRFRQKHQNKAYLEVLNKAYLEVLNKAYLEVLNKAYLEAQSKAYPGALYQVHTENHVVHHCYS